MIKTLKYYSNDGTFTEFTKYTIDTNGVIRNKKGEPMSYAKTNKYNVLEVYDDSGKTRHLRVARAVASTFIGPPPTLAHTVDHKNRNRGDDVSGNIRWLCKSGQNKNQDRSDIQKTAFTVVKDGLEKTANDWAEHLKDDKNTLGHDYTSLMIKDYARRKKHGFSYKTYPDLSGEIWKEIVGSNNKTGRWEISNMNRVKYVTKFAENVLSGERLGFNSGYPNIYFNGKTWACHILSFMTFFPDEYAAKNPRDMVLHENDDKNDFRPHKLRLGTQSENMIDSYDNGKRDDTKSSRMRCSSYINGFLEQEHTSQTDAAKYLKLKGQAKSSVECIISKINRALNPKYITTFAYGRTWKRVD